MIYLIGGVAGMRKTSIITPCFRARKLVYHNSTNDIRASTNYLLTELAYDITKNKYEIKSLPSAKL
ncbi:MAG: hypothetical protein A3A04_02125 [Candidatus Harrisonbacteria bacterium RIFCSPLOWO2_01_FULL_40_28]|uniref:Uncharacterized protein n=2 Tax=Candidatus Harrisoniibacteriota TaxID=1817905 RepID=A0A1G1ZUX9_9BACT|nr:MAG: hypothetical protein A3A04_02125 [Candidatus Harrisonbacteria bacterium RIFCSPLOWO2_01_FULL_40_28]OGY68493.1 MAG: hypothetical protein A2586_02055 [Candidatus Harrisonbacteria bacterium RIFOXYD1_FULL_40_9]